MGTLVLVASVHCNFPGFQTSSYKSEVLCNLNNRIHYKSVHNKQGSIAEIPSYSLIIKNEFPVTY